VLSPGLRDSEVVCVVCITAVRFLSNQGNLDGLVKARKESVMRLEGRVAIVTGGGKGLGRAISLAFAREGADVVVAARTEAALKEVASEIETMGRKSLTVVIDLIDPEQPLTMVNRTLEEFGRIDVLVNNSGIEGPTASVADMDLEGWNQVLAINLTGAMLCAKHVLKSMIPRQSGNIINISSGAGRWGFSLRSPYSVSKWGIISLTQSLAREVGEYGIRVNCIAPGPVEGDRIDRVYQHRSELTGKTIEELMEIDRAKAALHRLIELRLLCIGL